MAITRTSLGNLGSASNLASYPSGSITPTAGALGLAWVASALTSGTPGTPTASGNNGNNWTVVHSITLGVVRLTLMRCLFVNPTAGAVTVDFAAAAQQRCAAVFLQLTSNTPGAVITLGTPAQYTSSSSASATVTLTGTGTYAVMGMSKGQNADVFVPESGWTITNQVAAGGEALRLGVMDRNDAADLTPLTTYTTACPSHAIGVLIREVVSVGPAYPDVVVGGVKKSVTAASVIVGGVKKPVVGLSVVVAGAKKPVV